MISPETRVMNKHNWGGIEKELSKHNQVRELQEVEPRGGGRNLAQQEKLVRHWHRELEIEYYKSTFCVLRFCTAGWIVDNGDFVNITLWRTRFDFLYKM